MESTLPVALQNRVWVQREYSYSLNEVVSRFADVRLLGDQAEPLVKSIDEAISSLRPVECNVIVDPAQIDPGMVRKLKVAHEDLTCRAATRSLPRRLISSKNARNSSSPLISIYSPFSS